jgi:hypothetical protein
MYSQNKQPNNTILSLIFIAIGLFFLLCTACENKTAIAEKPNDLLEQKTFESLLWELYLIEGDVRFRIRNENIDTLRIRTTAKVNAMYEKYNINHEQFLKNYAYYMQNADLSEEMMKNIVNQLVELQAKEEAKAKEQDSIAVKITACLAEVLPLSKLAKQTDTAKKR